MKIIEGVGGDDNGSEIMKVSGNVLGFKE